LLRLVRPVRIQRSGWPSLGGGEAATQQHHRQQRKPFHRSLSGSDGHVGTLIQWSRKGRNSSGYLKDASLPRRASISAMAASASGAGAGGGATWAWRVWPYSRDSRPLAPTRVGAGGPLRGPSPSRPPAPASPRSVITATASPRCAAAARRVS